jgi:cell division protein FtsI/penicillin-binding protein 2
MSRARLNLVVALLALWLSGLAGRLFHVQVLGHEVYEQRAERQQQRVVKLDPPRGTIFDARGRELAVSVEVRSVAADPTFVDDPEATAAALATALDLDRKRLAETLAADRAFVWIRRKLDPPDVEKVLALDLDGVFTLPESKRYYPMGSLAAHILGFVGTDDKGLAGVEFLYDRTVRSEQGQQTVVRDARRGTVRFPGLGGQEPRPGKSVVLTVDAAIQHVVEQALKKAVENSGASRGSVVMMDPHTGAVLAMASYPTFDPNHFNAAPADHQRNLALAEPYEPGSTFKMVTLAAALEANAVDPLEKIDCLHGGITLRGTRINDHRSFGALTTREIIAQSSNVGAIKLGMKAGRERLYDTIRGFGFGRPTGIDLPGERAGILRPLEIWTPLEPAYAAFGQGLSINALQLVDAFAAIANGGFLPRPHVVAAIGPEDGERVPVELQAPARMAIAATSITQVRSMLESVVLDGTGKAAAIPGYSVAGKTGTAEKAFKGRGYVAGKYVASFVGFAPVRRPVVVCAVVLDEPWPRYHGGDVAAPVFAEIVGRTLMYLDVPPDDPEREHRWRTASKDGEGREEEA